MKANDLEAKLRAVTAAADQERKDDEANAKILHNLPGKFDDSRHPPTLSFSYDDISTVCTTIGGRETQEDRAGFFFCQNQFANDFLARSLENKVVLVTKQVQHLVERTQNHESGTTLTFNIMWTESNSTHILTIQIGDSRATVISDNAVTRLTCEHSLSRPREIKQTLTDQGFKLQGDDFDNIRYRSISRKNKTVAHKSNTHIYAPFSENDRKHDPYCGLAISRTLGDASVVKRCGGVVHSKPDISYFTTKATDTTVLATYSDGIINCSSRDKKPNTISDKDLQFILKNAGHDFAKAAQTAFDTIDTNADWRSVSAQEVDKDSDNKTLVFTRLTKIPKNTVACQFVVDGHGNSCRTAILVQHELHQLFQAVFKPEHLRHQAMHFVHDVLWIYKDKRVGDSEKYDALQRFRTFILAQLTEVQYQPDDEVPIKTALRNFICLALQRNKWGTGISGASDAGDEVIRLLQLPEFLQLKTLLLGEAPVDYPSLRQFVTGSADDTANKALFSSDLKTQVFEFWRPKSFNNQRERQQYFEVDYAQELNGQLQPAEKGGILPVRKP